MDDSTQGIKISFTANSLVKLIEALKKNGASEFKYGNLYIKLSGAESPIFHTNELTDNQSAISESFPRTAEDQDPESRLQDLMIADPVAYEEALNAELDGSDISRGKY